MYDTDPSTLPILDNDTIAQLRELMEGEFNDLLETFLQDIANQLASLRTAVANDDAPMLCRTAHPLKSSSHSIGALRLSRLAQQLEAQGRIGEAAGLAPLLRQLEAVAEQTQVSLRKLLPS